jgi:hypothetical protein
METEALLKQALVEKDKEEFSKLIKAMSKLLGSWDKGGRFTIDKEFQTSTSKLIREPSRAWPHSEYKHLFTKKYLRSLQSEKFENLAVN